MLVAARDGATVADIAGQAVPVRGHRAQLPVGGDRQDRRPQPDRGASGSPTSAAGCERGRRAGVRLGASVRGGRRGVRPRARPPYAGPRSTGPCRLASHRVLDLAAGTGKLTACSSAAGLDVVAIDPSPAMLARAAGTAARRRGSRRQRPRRRACPTAAWTRSIIGIGTALVRPAGRGHRDGSGAASGRGRRGFATTAIPTWPGCARSTRSWTESTSGPAQTASSSSRIEPPRPGPLRSAARRAPSRTSHSLDCRAAGSSWSRRARMCSTMAPRTRARSARWPRCAQLARTHPDLRGREQFDLPYSPWWRAAFRRCGRRSAAGRAGSGRARAG